MKIEIGQHYSSGCYETLAEIYDRSFVLYQDLAVGNIIVLTDVDLRKSCDFLDIPFEISGDYCCFEVVESTDMGLVLVPAADMYSHVSRAYERPNMRLLFRRSDYTIILRLHYKPEHTAAVLAELADSDLVNESTRASIKSCLYAMRRRSRT